MDAIAEALQRREVRYCRTQERRIQTIEQAREFVERVRAVNEVDLSYPIILAAEGWIMDGRTRLQKALLLGHRDIATIRFSKTPEPDERKPKNQS